MKKITSVFQSTMKTVAILVVVLLCHGTKPARGMVFPPHTRGRHIENELQMLKPGLKLVIIEDEDIMRVARPSLVPSWLWDLFNKDDKQEEKKMNISKNVDSSDGNSPLNLTREILDF